VRGSWTSRLAVLLAAGLAIAAVDGPSRAAPPSASAPPSCAAGYVALTFDDGPGPTTPALLAALTRNGLRATMFDVGERAAAHPELVRAQVAAGMWVENHTLTHPHLTQESAAGVAREIAGAQRILGGLTGAPPTLLRPPYLATDARVRAAIRQHGLLDVLATVDSRDYAGASTAQIIAAARRLRSGGIVLMHDWPPATIAAVPGVAAVLAGRHLCAGHIAADAHGRAHAVAP
jgi:peptidoglycan/xylan/chitin deacetylase (PgdA/CDA1 family)